MKKDGIDHIFINYLIENILDNIGFLYYKNDPIKRILKDSGVYERDIDVVYEYVKDCIEDNNQIRDKLKERYGEFKDKLSFLTKYSIERM
jgi:hypothetical protein